MFDLEVPPTLDIPPSSLVSFHLDSSGQPIAIVRAFHGKKIFPLEDKVIQSLLVSYYAASGFATDKNARALYLDMARVNCHVNGMYDPKGEWKEAMLDDDTLLRAIVQKARMVKIPYIKRTREFQRSLALLAKKEGFDSSEWADLRENKFSQKLRSKIILASETDVILEKAKPNNKGSRWRLWRAEQGVSSASTPPSTPESTPPSSLDNHCLLQDLRTEVQMGDDLDLIRAALGDKRWKGLGGFDIGRGTRHVLLLGPPEQSVEAAEFVVHQGEHALPPMHVSLASLTKNAVEEMFDNMAGYPDRILISVKGIDVVSDVTSPALYMLLDWLQATCVCTAQSDEALPDELWERIAWVCDLSNNSHPPRLV